MNSSILTRLEEKLGQGRVKQQKDISPYLTLRTKTQAEYYFEAESKEDIVNAYKAAKELKLSFFLLGGGSNLAVTKPILPGLIVRNLYQKLEVLYETSDTVDILVSSGYSMGRLVSESTRRGWEGFEYHLGLPGSVGGGIYMNSKWTKPVSYVGDSLVEAVLLDAEGNEKKVNREYFQFAYDHSILQETKEIVLEAIFRLKKNDPAILQQRAKEALAYRHQTQPFGVATAGCFFQNVNGKSAGQMIDLAGLKNTQIGDFIVSDKHANFIVNKGGQGKPEDLVQLIQLIKEKVKDKFQVELEEEVRIV